jgi:hypothetical protein
MAKTSKPTRKNNNKRAGKAAAGAMRPRRSRGGGAVLDGAATEYARLLMDPCGARIVHPIFPGGDAGYLFRADSFVTVGVGATDTCGIVHWCPGYLNASNSDLIGGSAATATTSITTIAVSPSSPGKVFLQTQARGVRCVAACLKVTFPGNEAQRAGRIHYGQTTAGLFDVGEGVTTDNVAQALQHYTRTPADIIEMIWRPNIADTEFNDASATSSAQVRDRKSALTMAYAGLPAGVGLTLHFTAVYEWTPATGVGIGHNTMGKAVSRNTLDDVLDAIKSTGFQYIRQAAMTAGQSAMAGAMASVYGRMGAIPHTRRLNF